MKTVVLVPCYNEGVTIKKVVGDFQKVLPDAEVLVYDNNSTDGSADLARQAGATVVFERRQGKGNVVRSMFRDVDADCYLMVDGDDTYPAECAGKMVEMVRAGVDMVIGDRLSSTYAEENKRPFHNFGNTLVRTLVNRCFGGNVTDIMTGYRAFSRRFVKTFPSLSNGFETETEMTIHALDKKLVIESLVIEYRDRPRGSESKLNTFSDGFRVLLTIVNMLKEYRPLAFFGGLTVLLILAATVGFVPVLIDYCRTGLVPRFPTLIMSGVLFIIACVLLTCGLVMDMIARKSRERFEIILKGARRD